VVRLPSALAALRRGDVFQHWLVPISLVFPFVLWGVIGVIAGIAAFGLFSRYAKRT